MTILTSEVAAAPEVASEAPAATTTLETTSAPSTWRDILPQDLKDDPSIAKFEDVSQLAKSYKSLQRTIGGNKISVPDKHATEDDWKSLFKQLGNPDKIEDYGISVEKDLGLDEEFFNWYKQTAHESGLLPMQAQSLINKFAARNAEYANSIKEQNDAALSETVQSLQKEWGGAFKHKVESAQQVVKELGGEDLVKALNDTGAGNNPTIIRAFAKMAEMHFKEDGIVKGAPNANTMTPATAVEKARGIMSDLKHPFNDKSHPNHGAAQAEVQKLYAIAYPE